MTEEAKKRLFTIQEAAHYLGFSPRTLYNGTGPRAKKPFPLKAIRIGTSVRFDLLDLDRFIEESKR